jgi:hypothetical protein
MSKVPMKQPEHFWNVDLIEVSRDWLSQIWTFLMTALTFFFLAMPVIIAAFIMWYMAGFPRLTL